MGHYDKATQDFMNKMSDQASQGDDQDFSLRPIRLAKQVLRGMEDPKKAISKALIRAAAGEIMEKDSSIKILKLYQFLNDKYDREWWDWEPETIWKSLEDSHIEGETPEGVKNAAMALQLTTNTHAPFEHWHIFEKVGHAFNSNPVSFAIVQPLEIEEACLTMAILKRIQPKTAFDGEVLTYVAACAKNCGVSFLPDDLAPGVQDKLNEITFEYPLREAVKKSWDKGLGGKSFSGGDDFDGYIQIQLSRLKEIKDYLQEKL